MHLGHLFTPFKHTPLKMDFKVQVFLNHTIIVSM